MQFTFVRSVFSCAVAASVVGLASAATAAIDPLPLKGKVPVRSMSALTFGPNGVLFIGDSKSGAVWAVDVNDRKPSKKNQAIQLPGFQARVAALLGTTPGGIMVHDLAVNPISQTAYLAISRGGSKWDSRWQLPNDIADANVLVKVGADKKIAVVSLDNVQYAKAELPNPVDGKKTHRWKKGTALRVDTITDIAFDDGTLYVAGLSNEEFASSMWQVPYPFRSVNKATTLEIFHGAHGKYETHAPIRAFLPYRFGADKHLLAAYLCTPLVDFRVADLRAGRHVKGRTVAEFGSGNYPLDMIVYQKDGQDRLLIANSNLPLMIVDPQDVAAFKGGITKEVKEYVAGVSYEIRSGAGIQQMARLNDTMILALQRLPGGTMDLMSMSTKRL